MFPQIVKIKWTIIGEADTASKNKNKNKDKYLNLKVVCHDQRSIFLFKATGLKIIPIQEKMIFQQAIIFHIPIRSSKK